MNWFMNADVEQLSFDQFRMQVTKVSICALKWRDELILIETKWTDDF